MADIDDEGVVPEIDYSVSTEKERIAAADKLQKWVLEAKPENQAILSRLESDMRSHKQLENWAQFALEDLIRPPRTDASQTKKSKIAGGLELSRNVLLFVPVMVTWIAISVASDASERYLRINPDGDLNFLQVWNSNIWVKGWGFFPALTLKNIATTDGILIALLIILTMVSQFLFSSVEKGAAKADLENDLAHRDVLVDVGLFLHGFRQITPNQLKSGLADAVNSLAKATSAIRETIVGLKDVSESADRTLARFADLASRELEPAGRRLDAILGPLGVAVDAHKSLGDMVLNLQHELGASLFAIKDGMESLGKILDTNLQGHTGKLEIALRGIMTETEGAAKRLTDASAAAQEVAEMMREVVRAK